MTVDNQIDTTTGTVKLRAQFPNTDGALFPNQFVNTRLLVRTLDNQIMVPSSAIQHNGDVAFVYLIKPGPGNPNARRLRPGPNQQANGSRPGGSAGQRRRESARQRQRRSAPEGPAEVCSRAQVPAAQANPAASGEVSRRDAGA